jgi:hypothetical protein
VDAVGAVAGDVAHDLAAAHGEADEGDVGEVQVGQQRVEVGGEGVVVVAVEGLGRLAEAAAVVGDDPVAGLDQRGDLGLPGLARQRPAVDEHDRAAGAVVLVVELDRGGVLGADGDRGHVRCSCRLGSGVEQVCCVQWIDGAHCSAP